MTRVLYLVTNAALGGAQMHILDLVRGSQNDVEPIVAVGEEGIFTAAVRNLGVPCYVVKGLVQPISLLKDMWALLEVGRLIRHVRADLVHAHTSKAGLIGRLAAKAAGVPSIFTAHTWSFAEKGSWTSHWVGVPSERLAGLLGSAVINISVANRDLALFHRVCSPERMITILKGISDTPHRASPDSPGIPTIVMVARCEKQKDHSVMLRALARLDQPARMRFAGDGPLLPALKTEAERLKIAHQVEFLGERADIPRILADAHIFTLASRQEVFPLSILEAMRAGLPVVASRVGGVSEAVAHGETGFLVDTSDANALQRRLSSLLSDPRLRRRMGLQGRRHYLERFTLSRMLAQTHSVYRDVLSGRPLDRLACGPNSPVGDVSVMRG